MILLAGVGLQAIWQTRGTLRCVGLAGAAVALFYVGLSSWWVNVDRGADPREMLVSTQSATDVKKVADQVQALADSRGPGKPPLTVTIDSSQGATFPYAWYFRHLVGRLHRPRRSENAPPPTSDVIVMTDEAHARLQNALQAATTAASSSSASGGCATTARSAPATSSATSRSARSGTPRAG